MRNISFSWRKGKKRMGRRERSFLEDESLPPQHIHKERQTGGQGEGNEIHTNKYLRIKYFYKPN
jgi:hypothetical protein